MMKGLDVFRNYFQAYSEQYVLIGGAACDIIFEEQDTAFRATKDLDLLNLACRYLMETEFGIGRIAQILGYCDQSYFSSEFKRHYGVYPTVYRNGNR